MLTFGRRLSFLSTLALLAALPLESHHQALQERAATQQIRVRTGEVVVDVNVTDSGGSPVRGLTAADFEVYEDGIKQQIASFRFISRNTLEQSQQAPSAAMPSSVLVADTPAFPHLVSLVFGKINVERGEALRAAEAAKAYVEKFLHKNDLVAVCGISMGVHVYQQFTNDRASLLKAIQDCIAGNTRHTGDVSDEIRATLASILGAGATIPGVSTDEQKIQAAYSASPAALMEYPVLEELLVLLKFRDFDSQARGNKSLTGLLSIIEGQKSVPGRKSMIFLSSGFALPVNAGRNLGGAMELRTITSAANRAGVTIYSIDVSGVRGQDPEEERQAALKAAMNSRAIVGPNTPLGLLSMTVGLNPLDNLLRLSEETGGYAVSNTGDLVAGIEKIGAYLEEYYVLTYTPSNLITDGKFRSISVKLKRPRLNVRARKGYYSLPDTDRLPLVGFEAELLEHINAKSPPASFPVYVGGYSFPGREAAPTAALFVQFPLTKFKFEKLRETRQYQAQADVLLLIKKADGSIIHRLSQQYELGYSQEPTEIMRKRGFSFYRRVPLESGDYFLEAVVRDRRTDNASVRKTEFHVAPANQQELALSSVALGRESVPAAENDTSENPFHLDDPLRVAETGVRPNLSAVYSKSSDKEILVYFVARARIASSQIQCTFEFFRDGMPDLKLEQAFAAIDAEGKVQCLKRIGLDQLKPGSYELRLNVSNASVSAFGVAKFRIDP
jgi:VWFA-related protein